MKLDPRKAYVDATTLPEDVAVRLQARLHRDEAAERGAYVAHTTASPVSLARIHRRIRTTERLRGRPAIGFTLTAMAATAIAVAGLTLALGRGTVEVTNGEVIPTVTVPIDNVALSFDGEGRIGGTERAPLIDWESGKLSVAVTPKKGVDLTVETPEAVVRVVGTVFAVVRSYQATQIDVTEGTVLVKCVGEDEVAVKAGQSRTCVPADLESRVARVAGMADADPEARIAAIGSALALAPGPALRGELLAHRVRALADLGRLDAAMVDAEAAIALESPRKAELAGFVARNAFAKNGCQAMAVLERVVAVDPASPESLLLATCLRTTDPARAQGLLDEAQPGSDATWAELAAELRRALDEVP